MTEFSLYGKFETADSDNESWSIVVQLIAPEDATDNDIWEFLESEDIYLQSDGGNYPGAPFAREPRFYRVPRIDNEVMVFVTQDGGLDI